MGLLSGLLGNAAEAGVADVEKTLERVLADDERVERAFQLVRDLLTRGKTIFEVQKALATYVGR